MKTFQQFITEAYFDPNVQGRSQVQRVGSDGSKIGAERKKTAPEARRVKAVGGGKTEPAKDYKPRKDIGAQRPRSQREQQPEKERGSAADAQKAAALAARRKAAQARVAARKSGGSASVEKKTKTASELLTTKTKQTVDPSYKPRKASGLTTKERKALYKKGERLLRDIRLKNLGKKSEKELKHKITSK